MSGSMQVRKDSRPAGSDDPPRTWHRQRRPDSPNTSHYDGRDRARRRQAVAGRTARRSPAAVRASKRAVYEGVLEALAKGFHLDRAGFVTSALLPTTKAAMRVFLERLATLPAGVPSLWADEALLRSWQDGTAADFTR